MAAWSESGMSKKAYCEEKKINYGTFLWWFQAEKRLENKGLENKMRGKYEGKFDPIAIEIPRLENKVKAQLPNGVELHFEKADTTIVFLL